MPWASLNEMGKKEFDPRGLSPVQRSLFFVISKNYKCSSVLSDPVALHKLMLRGTGLDSDFIARATAPFAMSCSSEEQLGSDTLLYSLIMALAGKYSSVAEEYLKQAFRTVAVCCILREQVLVDRPERGAEPISELTRFLRESYERCSRSSIRNQPTPLDRFLTKCGPWTGIVAAGTSVLASSPNCNTNDLTLATQSVTSVFSCLQLVDEWNDEEEDTARAHWNLWTDESSRTAKELSSVLEIEAVQAVKRLRSSDLKSVLALQLIQNLGKVRMMLDLANESRPNDSGPEEDCFQ